MKAKQSYDGQAEQHKLQIEVNDRIAIIEGGSDRYWWKGQNGRTLLVGYFPRAILDPLRKLNSDDISLPLRNSFIHTGHMSAEPNGKSWGNPTKIDE
jgi:activated CDC42 kinase 1